MKEIVKNKKLLSNVFKIGAVVLLLLFIFKGIFILVLLIILSLSMSYIVNNFSIRQIGIELVTLIAVLSAMKYGSIVGIIITFILITYHMVAGGFFGTYIFWVIPAYCLAACISGFFPSVSIIQLGIAMSFFINVINTSFTAFFNPAWLAKYMIFVITNIIFNVFLFTVAAPILLALM